MKRNVLALLGLAAAMATVGCVKTTRVVLNKEGKPVEEVTRWELLTLPVVYSGPVVHEGPIYVVRSGYYPYRQPVVYGHSYYRPYHTAYYEPRYTHRVHPIYLGGRSHHHHHRHH